MKFLLLSSLYAIASAIAVTDNPLDAVILGGTAGSLVLICILLMLRMKNNGATIVLLLLLFTLGAFAQPSGLEDKLNLMVKESNETKRQALKDEILQLFGLKVEIDSCDAVGYCRTKTGELKTITISDCLSIKEMTVEQAFCSINDLSSHCDWKSLVDKRPELWYVRHCLNELDDADKLITESKRQWISNRIKSIQRITSGMKKRQYIKDVILMIRSSFNQGHLSDVYVFKYYINTLIESIPSASIVMDELMVKGSVSRDTEQMFQTESTSRHWYDAINLKIDTIKKMLVVTAMLMAILMVMLLFGPKAFKLYVALFVVLSIIIVGTVMIW